MSCCRRTAKPRARGGGGGGGCLQLLNAVSGNTRNWRGVGCRLLHAHQQQRLPMNVQGIGGDGGEEALEHAQLHAVIRNVVAPAQQLHRLRLQLRK